MTPRFEIFKGKNDQFYFRLRAGNGKTVCQSEGYTRKSNCIEGCKAVKWIASAHTIPIAEVSA